MNSRLIMAVGFALLLIIEIVEAGLVEDVLKAIKDFLGFKPAMVIEAPEEVTYTIEGDTIYIDIPNKGRISQTPHTLNDFTNQPIVNFTSYFATEQCFDFAFGFDTEKAKASSVELYDPRYVNETKSYTCDCTNCSFNYTLSPKYAWCWEDRNIYNCTDEENCTVIGTETILKFGHYFETGSIAQKTIYWNETRFIEWDDISDKFGLTDYQGKKYYYITGINFQPSETKTIRPVINVKPKLGENSGKYDILIKRCSDSLTEAYSSGNYVLIDPWWNSSWSYMRKLTFSDWTGPLTENLTNFPILVVLNDTWTNYTTRTKPDGTDLRFIDDDNSTELDYHIEKWNTSGDSFVWVEVPLLDNSSTDHIWMYYNYSLASDSQDETGTYDNDYVGVWHLHSVNGTNHTLDSTQHDNDGTATNFNTDPASSVTSGQIDNATEFDGSDDYVDVSASSELSSVQGAIEFWIKPSNLTSSGWGVGGIAYGENLNNKVNIEFVSDDRLRISNRWYSEDWPYHWIFHSSKNSVPVGEWTHVVLTQDRTAPKIYINGKLDATASSGNNLTSWTDVKTGYGYQFAKEYGTEYFNGTLDEIRISNVSRNSAWINASYLSQTDNLITFGSEKEVDNTKPYFSTNSTNTTTAGQPVNFSIVVHDETAVDFCRIETNNTGTFINSSWQDISGTSENCYYETTLNSTSGLLIQWRAYANDTSNNQNVSQTFNLTTVAAVVPVVNTCHNFHTTGDLNCTDNCVNGSVNVTAPKLVIYSTGAGTVNFTDTINVTKWGWNFTHACRVIGVDKLRVIG